MREILLFHAKKYPQMQPSDVVKLIYQATFGGGHMINDEASAAEYIRCEYESCAHDCESLYCESLGDTARVYLNGVLGQAELDLIASVFCESARLYSVGYSAASAEVRGKFLHRLDTARELCREGCFGFTQSELEAYLSGYASAGYPPVRHSDAYREAYRPAYRVIDSSFVALIERMKK